MNIHLRTVPITLLCALSPVVAVPGRADSDSSGSVPAANSAAQDPKAQSAPKPVAVADKGWKLFGSLRFRAEDQNFFVTPKGNGAYTFYADTVRVGVQRHTPKADYLFELESPGLWDLPTKAIAPAPQGQLGQGATYYASNHGRNASIFLKQAFIKVKEFSDRGNSLKLGRFEYGDGTETTSTDAALNWVKLNRVAQRFIGPFGYTIVTRSFDGLIYAYNKPKYAVNVAAFSPTRGAFDLNGWDTLGDVRVVYLSGTTTQAKKSTAFDARLFYLYYDDERRKAVKADNRPAAARTGDTAAIVIHTFGANYERVVNAGPGKADIVLWGAGQVGKWGVQDHGAFAIDGEVGYQFPKATWKPWIRFVYYLASGDGNPSNNVHGTFFPILPTARVYVRYPFYSQTNIQDIFGMILLKPSGKLALRGDVHSLRLAQSKDLWYGGAGAYTNGIFGYAGRPSGGAGDLATLVDLSADYQVNKNTSLTLYGAYANGGRTVGASFTGRDSVFGYFEANVKF